MKILYHHRTLADGAEGVHIAEMVGAFRALGHEVRVLGLAADEDAPDVRGWIAQIRGLLPGVVFEAASVATNVVEYVQAQRAIREFGPDFLYKRHARNDVGTILAARRARVPLVLEVNCLFTGPGYRQFEPLALERVAADLEKRALRAATVRLAVSTPLARQIRDVAGVDAIVVPNGADPVRFDPARTSPDLVRVRYGLGDSLVVGWTGVIREWHGLELLLEAIVSLPAARVLIVGDGPGRTAVHERAEALGVAERIVITGRVPHREMRHYIAVMDIAVVAHDRTGVASPMKLLEYMAMARAVVAPRIENVQDIISHERCGVLFQPDDAGNLADTLRTLASDKALRERLGSAARHTIESSRNWGRIAEEVVSQIDRLRTSPMRVPLPSQKGRTS